MSEKGMLPLPLAFEVKREIYDFLNVSFEIKATKSGEALKKYYTETSPLIQGPFVKVSLPYEATRSSNDSPLRLVMKYPPYRHQINAFKRLNYTEAKNTIVTTGTGSGKTECFLYPILDYVSELKIKGKGQRGVKAIILYPMNALLDDQAIRFIKTIKEHNLQDLDIRVGKYTGNSGRSRSMNFKENKVIDHRDELVANPPDILLTNYKMLDYMLFRDQEKPFWNEQTKEFFKYLVLDEMHTFDGAQGSDVACLIRRLKAVSGAEERMVFVGTSATLSSSENAKKELCEFASSLFGSKFSEEAIVTETKHTVESYLGKASLGVNDLPTIFKDDLSSLEYVYGETLEEHVKKILKAFDKEELFSRPNEIGNFLKSHKIFTALVDICSREILSFNEIIEKISESMPQYQKKIGNEGLIGTIKAFLTLASFARHDSIPNFPFLNIKISLWASELKQTLSKVVGVDEEWEFVDENDVINSQSLHLPSVYCTNCGESGWASFYTENEDTSIKSIISKPHTIRLKHHDDKGCILFPITERVADSDEIHYLYRNQRKLISVNEGQEEGEDPIPVIKVLVKEGRCPACDSKLNVRFFSLGSSSLSSIIATSCFSHPLNRDRKLISFSDSVQDASHQASFLNNRAFSFSFKKFVSSKLHEGMTLTKAQALILSKENVRGLDLNAKLDVLGKFAPDKLRKKWMLTGLEGDRAPSNKMIESLCDVVEYNTLGEFTFNSRLGWSFEKVGHSGFFIDQNKWNDLLKIPRNIWIEKDESLRVFENDHMFQIFLYGFLQRLKSTGVVYTRFLDKYYQDKKADYYVAYKYHEDLPLLGMISKPKFFTPLVDSVISRKQNFETLGGKNSWYWRWLTKFGNTTRIMNFYEDFCQWLHSSDVLIRVGNTANGEGWAGFTPRYVLNPDFLLYEEKLEYYECEKCKTRFTAPKRFADVVKGSPCSQRFCDGKVGQRQTIYTGSYFQRYFSQHPLRINASEHTGSFDKDLKEKVEGEFKKPNTLTPNFDTNFLSCTPTMEMGIDIGDLSSVILKSVPKNAASYFQRIGRSGRTTGNSLDFLVIDRKPHNLYFWIAPKELLGWEVVTPSCRFKTGHILQRQYNAYVMDQFLHTSDYKEIHLPMSFQWLADSQDSDCQYWVDIFKFEKLNRPKLFERFIKLFDLSNEVVGKELEKYVEGDGVYSSFEKVFQSVRDELTILNQVILDLSKEISDMRSEDNNFFENVEKAFRGEEGINLEELLVEFNEVNQKMVNELYSSLISARKKKNGILSPQVSYLLSKLSDSGVLPGYAFPEEGCELDFNIKKPISKSGTVKDPFYNLSITRSPESALSDFAPYNHFYTHGFEAIVDRLGIFGKKDPFIKLGSCFVCGHVTKLKICEFCNSDVELSLAYEFKKVKANTAFDKSYVSDSKETREKKNYDVQRRFLFDGPNLENSRKRICFFNEDSQFGYEFQTNVEIYSFNLGFKTSQDAPKPFQVCKTCGAVAKPNFKMKGKVENKDLVNHYHSCSAKQDELVPVSLFRHIKSDAVRIPVLNSHMIPIMKTVLKRAVEIHLKGNTGHITISNYSQEGYEGNTFLVIFDNVPGGTGHLRDLFGISLENNDTSSSPKQFLRMFRDVLDHVRKCTCEDGCYHCVWSADNIKDKERVTKKGVIFHLTRLLAQEEKDFTRRDAGLLDVVRESSFDGQTEVMLFHALNALGPGIPFEDFQFRLEPEVNDNQSSLWKVQFKDSHCFLKSSPYESIKLEIGGATKPDFHVLNNKHKIVGFIYTDGSRYHLNPGNESTTFEQDIILRAALSKEQNVPVISLTYKDLDELNNAITNDEDLLRLREAFEFNEKIFDDAILKNQLSISEKRRLNLNLSLILRMLKIASGIESELKQSELVPSFLPWVTNYNSTIMKFNKETKCLEISTNIELRSDKNSFNNIYTISEDYYYAWITFWQCFNVASMAELLRKQFKYKSHN